MQAEIQIELGLSVQPRYVGLGFGGFWIPIIAVQINAAGVLTRIQNKTFGIQAGEQPNSGVRRPLIFLDHTQCRERPRRFIAVDAGADVNSDFWLPTSGFWSAMQRK